MLKHRHIDKICIAVILLACVLTAGFMNGEKLGIRSSYEDPEYASRIFDDGRVHTVDIRIEDWEGFLENASEEEYSECDVEIDGEVFSSVGLRAKGNNSLRLVQEFGLKRYSLKLEFDHFQDGSTYYGLDKLSLDSSYQDNSYLKNYLAYDMMEYMGVPSPLTSYVWVTVNGEDWGLFLAVEEPEESFARRNYGADHGQLYKPDYRSLEAENSDVALKYTSDDPADYDNIFRNVLRYFTVQVFTVNLDSYLGRTGHNYFLYEEDGILSILPWDYNLAFATYSLGMPDPVNDAELYVNYPINTPAAGEIMRNRPLYHNLMKNDRYFARYHEYFDQFIGEYFESGLFERRVAETTKMIAPYVEKDPTAFCSYEDYLTAVRTITDFCLLRAESVRGQLSGEIPSTIRGQQEDEQSRVDASDVWLPDMGEIADLRD